MTYLSVTIARGAPIVAPRNPHANAYDISATVALRRLLRSGNTALPSDSRIPYNVRNVIKIFICTYTVARFMAPHGFDILLTAEWYIKTTPEWRHITWDTHVKTSTIVLNSRKFLCFVWVLVNFFSMVCTVYVNRIRTRIRICVMMTYTGCDVNLWYCLLSALSLLHVQWPFSIYNHVVHTQSFFLR